MLGHNVGSKFSDSGEKKTKTRAIRGRCLHRMPSLVREAQNAGAFSNLLLT
jgi:hypothetical protein